MLKKFLIVLVFILLFFGLTSNVNAEPPFSFEESELEIWLNGSRSISFSGGTGDITWTSEDPSIATVDNGTVRGLKIGETRITATRGEETATCKIKVVYSFMKIGSNGSDSVSNVNLILGEHDSENLYATVEDNLLEVVNNAEVSWKSSDSSIVTVDNTSGKITAVKSGTATITAEAAGVSDTCEVTVYDAPVFTDFKNAKYETKIEKNDETFKITGVTPKDDSHNDYYYIITSSNTKPEIVTNKFRKY